MEICLIGTHTTIFLYLYKGQNILRQVPVKIDWLSVSQMFTGIYVLLVVS